MTTVQAVHQVTGSLGNRSAAPWYRRKIAANARNFRASGHLAQWAKQLIAVAKNLPGKGGAL